MAPLPLWLSCCAVRDGDERASGLVPASAPRDATSCGDDDFFDCAETLADLMTLESGKPRDCQAPQEDINNRRPDYCTDFRGDCTELPAARADLKAELSVASPPRRATRFPLVLERTLELFGQRVSELTQCGPELEWADLSAAKRMLRATDVDVKKAVDMFVQALELRARYRELFRTMQCQTCCDIRIFSRDVEDRPVIYMCARSLNVPIGTIREQFMVTFEAACRATTKEGRVTFLIDMHGMRPHLYMDVSAIKELAETLGTVFAERIHRVIIVDFSRAAQAAWWILKPMLMKKTRDKFAFIGKARAVDICRDVFSKDDHEKLCRTFDINRDPDASEEERSTNARRTTMCNVPLGPPLK